MRHRLPGWKESRCARGQTGLAGHDGEGTFERFPVVESGDDRTSAEGAVAFPPDAAHSLRFLRRFRRPVSLQPGGGSFAPGSARKIATTVFYSQHEPTFVTR